MLRGAIVCSGLIALTVWAPRVAAAPSAPVPAPPGMGFTPDVRADTAEGSATGQNEPVTAVDQTGKTYITWQGASNGGTNTVSTSDGISFQALGATDSSGNEGGDVAMATSSWPNPAADTPTGAAGSNDVVWADLGSNTCGLLGFRASFSLNQGTSWTPTDAGCQPFQVDRDWVAAYTPPAFRGTAQAAAHTLVYDAYHDFGASDVWVSRSTDGGVTWTAVQQSAIQAGSAGQLTSLCNTYPGGVAVDQNGVHAGRVYVVWDTGDPPQNGSQGCNLSSAQPFDHVFLSYSDDGGSTWTTHAVFNDPCAPTPPAPPVDPTTCQDTSEGWTPVAVDDSGNVYVAFTWLNVSSTNPEYDVFLEVSQDGGNTWNGGTSGLNGVGDAPGAPIKVNSTTGTHYYPEIAAGGNGGFEVAWYRTPYVTVTGALQKPATQPGSAVWDVWIAQSLNVLGSGGFTQSQVTTHPLYFGDICTIGIACGTPIPGAAADRILADNFGIAVGPDGGARITWTDARDSWGPGCLPTTSPNDDTAVFCQTTHVYFACQTTGLGIHGETVTGCGQSLAVQTPEVPLVPALLLGGAAVAVAGRRLIVRRPASSS
ncbi:MAG: exo-alpha-sialidase [Chloroflexi bacterium]|nr:MAG: exo-alpha-sialidase [Chloroflexota bacterium]